MPQYLIGLLAFGMRLKSTLVAALLFTLGCNGGSGDGGPQFPGTVSSEEASSESVEGSSDSSLLDIGSYSSTASSSGDGDGDGMIPDLPEPGDIPEDLCKNIDFLFVVDNSGSMSDNQMNLIMNFPTLLAGVTNYIPTLEDFHLGVVTTDNYSYNEPGCMGLGNLVTQTGNFSSQNDCGPFADGYRFMTHNDTDLTTKFECVANVGTSGNSIERPLDAITSALETWPNSPGACNESFFRPDDALLVIVIITDEDDLADPQNIYSHVTWLKNDSPNEVVVLSLANTGETQACGSFYSSNNVIEFTNKFYYGVVGDVCAPDYAPFLSEAVGWIGTACGYPPVE